jgi:hypothetical protein
MLTQVLKLIAILSQCQVKMSEVQSTTTYKCHDQVVDDLLELFDGLQMFKLKACYE